MAGRQWSVRRLPVRIGRATECDLILDDAGVWNEHVELSHDATSGFYATSLSEGSVIINNHPVESAVLKNGDTLTLGAAALQFWIAPAVQKRFRWLELAVWLGLAILCIGQVIILRWLE